MKFMTADALCIRNALLHELYAINALLHALYAFETPPETPSNIRDNNLGKI